MFFEVIAPIPCQFVNDRRIEARVGAQMNTRSRATGIPTISSRTIRSRRVMTL